MQTTSVKSIYSQSQEFYDKEVKVEGWIRTIRSSKSFGFIEVNDGSMFSNIQIVFEEGVLQNYQEVAKYKTGAAICVEGVLVATPEAKQAFEIKASMIQLAADSDGDYPLQKKRHTLEYMRSIAHLRPRANIYSAAFRVRSTAAFAIHRFFQEKNFVYVNTPIITANDAEGAGELFQVTTLPLANTSNQEIDYKEDFFGKKTSLTVSGQLEAEVFALSHKNVYTFGPTFRAENSNTARHAAEFWMIEPEMAFTDIHGNMDLAEEMIKYVIDYVIANNPEEIQFFNQFVDKDLINRLKNVIESDFERITYTQAIEILQQSKESFVFPVSWGMDLQTEHERYITEKVYHKPVFVTDYPKEIKAFYMRRNDDGKTVAAMDLLAPGVGEIIGGSQREERYDHLLTRIEEAGIEAEDLWWYLELRKYGCVYHSGYGLGFERLIMYLTGISNIRDVIPFPRTPKHAEF